MDGREVEIPASRLDILRDKLEAGEALTEDDLRRVSQLQQLDTVEMGRNYVLGELWCWNELLQIDETLQEKRKKDLLERAGIDVI